MRKEVLNKFWVVALISNSVRYKSRVRLFKKLREEMKRAGAQLIVVELAHGERRFQVTEAGNPHHLQLRSTSEIWHKENMINLGVKRLSEVAPDWKVFAFIDADVSFIPSNSFSERENWVKEIMHQHQHYQVLQLFQTAVDLGPQGHVFATHKGFAWSYVEGLFNANSVKYTQFHPGYAWSMRREAYNHLGGLIETAVLGAGDRHMAYAYVGEAKASLEKGLHPNYSKAIMEFQARSERYIQRDIGFLPGTLAHHYHGSKRTRFYHTRWQILVKNQFDPYTDLKRNDQGLLELVVMSPRQIQLRDDIRKYFRARNEDSIDVE